MTIQARNVQSNIYVRGIAGKKPSIPVSALKLAALAKEKLSAEAYSYVAGGAGIEQSMKRNRKDFNSYRLRPQMLNGQVKVDLSIELFGQTYETPFFLAPIGVLDLAHPNGDIEVAKAASQMNVPMIISNQASAPMEDMRAKMNTTLPWFQLYWSQSNDLVRSLVQRAEACGCQAIVITLDTTQLGWRPQDLDLAYLPFLRGMGIAQYTSDPVFQRMLEEGEGEQLNNAPRPPFNWQTLRTAIAQKKNYPGGFWKNIFSDKPTKAVRLFINSYSRPTLSWEDIPFIRECTSLPILLKGITHPKDALRAKELGMDGIIVSNHGGRQVDGTVSSIASLPRVIDAVGPAYPVLFDSGIRSGTDAMIALALGAKAVCVGRPYVYALSIAGQKGVEDLLSFFISELELNMSLSSINSIQGLNREMLLHD